MCGASLVAATHESRLQSRTRSGFSADPIAVLVAELVTSLGEIRLELGAVRGTAHRVAE